jgi:hypothetical protein
VEREEQELIEGGEHGHREWEIRDAEWEAMKKKWALAEREAKKRAERMERTVREARETQERFERKTKEEVMEKMKIATKRRAEREAAKKVEQEADREARQREEEEKKLTAPGIPSTWGSLLDKNNDRRGKTSGLSQKDESHGLPLIRIIPSVPDGIIDCADNVDFFTEEDSSGGAAEEVELHMPRTREEENGFIIPSNLSKAATPSETVGMGKFVCKGFHLLR